ncbi:MAG: hypothetical protein ACLQKY_03100 [Terracidiphilus sp.]
MTGSGAAARTKVAADTPDTLSSLRSIGDALDSPDRHPVHILYVHGINAVGAGDSAQFREAICTRMKLCAVSDWKNAGVEFADKGEFSENVEPPSLQYLGSPIWNNADEWHASAPFVVHWVVHLRHHPAVLVVDELNWWPVVLAIKCRRIVAGEANVAGASRQLLNVCSERSAQDPDGTARFYPWLTEDQAKKLAAIPPRSVLVNRELKDGLVDWGLSDVLLSVGPMGGILRDGLRQLMAKSSAFDPNGGEGGVRKPYDWRGQLHGKDTLDQEFVGVTHSLGSYLYFNTLSTDAAVPGQTASEAARLAAENDAVRYIFERTSQVYFFANQLHMLEITNLETAPEAVAKSHGLAPAPEVDTTPAANLRALVHRWQQLQADFQAALNPADETAREKIQVVAWSDPSDVITWRVPRIGNVDVVNLYVQNATRWFGLFESPTGAHDNYSKNIDILRVMFLDTAHSTAH